MNDKVEKRTATPVAANRILNGETTTAKMPARKFAQTTAPTGGAMPFLKCSCNDDTFHDDGILYDDASCEE